jgi:hypothetical protein
MCKTAVARPGLIGLIRAWLFGPVPGRPPLPGECKRCGVIMESEDDDSLHAGWCYTCDAKWFETEIIAPLVHRLGRRGAVRAFKRLVSNVKALV